MTRIIFLAILSILAAMGGAAQKQAARPLPAASLDFIHLSDTHVIDLKGIAAPLVKQREHFADSERRLGALLAGVGRPGTESFALITGDLIDAFSFTAAGGGAVHGQINAFRRAVAKSTIPLYLTLGNHDIEHYGIAPDGVKAAGDQWLAGQARAAWVQAAECFRAGTYYEFAKQVGRMRYVFLMLDDGYVATGSKERPAVTVAHEQLFWLHRRIQANADAVLILAMHIPLSTNANSQAIRQAAAGAPNVALVLAGHNHTDGIEDLELGAGHAVQVRTAALGYGAENWRRIRLREDGIEVYATGSKMEVLRTIRLPAAAKKTAA